ncbi:hypothetical protein D6D27_06385 [Aureobasidium pullulans]|nr:hypothetical protein D6D27_06385 [Aureobasidium pullulans]
MVDESLLQLVKQLQQQPKCPDWGAKLQHTCEAIWSALDDDSSNSSNLDAVDEFIALLQQTDAFTLARLVIPELRATKPPVLSSLKQKIINQTTHQRTEALGLESNAQSEFDSHLYRQEKEEFTEAEMFRASLLLYGSASFDGVQEEEIIQWLASRPKKPVKD